MLFPADYARRHGTVTGKRVCALWMNLIGVVGIAVAMVCSTRRCILCPYGKWWRDISVRGDVIALAFLCPAGFAKAAQMPFSGWLLGAMVAPTPVSALLHSSTMVKAVEYLIVRFAPSFRDTYPSYLVALMDEFAFVVKAMLAISQQNAKRVLAYSTVSNLGVDHRLRRVNYLHGAVGEVMLIIFHAISKGLLFMAVGVIEGGIHIMRIRRLYGAS